MTVLNVIYMNEIGKKKNPSVNPTII